jgi:hypothetical protein
MTLKLHPSTAPSGRTPRRAAIIVVLSIVGILVLSLWYLVQPLPLSKARLMQPSSTSQHKSTAASPADRFIGVKMCNRASRVDLHNPLARRPKSVQD